MRLPAAYRLALLASSPRRVLTPHLPSLAAPCASRRLTPHGPRWASSMSAAADGSHGSEGSVTVRSMWPVGTWDDPVPITSSGDARVVGCSGPHHAECGQHPLTWITVEKGRLCQCPCCRQVFKLEVRGSE